MSPPPDRPRAPRASGTYNVVVLGGGKRSRLTPRAKRLFEWLYRRPRARG